ncbi:MAG: 50S ribosomal protein L23 [Deltaproteobacteria bacterium]|nr:50S ribosomal protein L23 [Deltaproteobacteria bacterium]MCX7953468.1 50S ribosomal protein L23 [Deltaproteobacteria bacterium]
MSESYKLFDTIIEPVISEKAFKLGQGGGELVFYVNPGAQKHDIKNAIEKIFEVKVKKVRVLNQIGKKKRTKLGTLGTRPRRKKAYVTLMPGYRVDLFE